MLVRLLEQFIFPFLLILLPARQVKLTAIGAEFFPAECKITDRQEGLVDAWLGVVDGLAWARTARDHGLADMKSHRCVIDVEVDARPTIGEFDELNVALIGTFVDLEFYVSERGVKMKSFKTYPYQQLASSIRRLRIHTFDVQPTLP